MLEKMAKIIYDATKPFQFFDEKDILRAAYFPKIDVKDEVVDQLKLIEFTRVEYISRFGKANRTPRLTWCYGHVNSNIKVDKIDYDHYEKYKLNKKIGYLSLPNDKVVEEIVNYKGLNFTPEVMPDWLERLSLQCRAISIENYGFDPEYNSCIIGRYDDRDDQIGFHFDTETFLSHHFCANVTLGYARDFQFKYQTPNDEKQLYEIKLQDKSLFFFFGLEHSLPKRAAIKPGEIRYSISFRNMKNNVGIGNSYYYCRGLVGAIDDNDKVIYQNKLTELQH